MPHVVFGLCFSCPHFLCLFVCVCLSLLLSAPVMFCSLVCSLFVLLFLFFVCCSCSLFVVLVLCLFFVCCFCSFVCSSILCLLFLFFVLTVWWFVLFPKRLRVGIQRQWGKNTCEDCQKDWLYWPILGGYRFFFFLIVSGGWGNVVAWSFYMLMTPLFSQPQVKTCQNNQVQEESPSCHLNLDSLLYSTHNLSTHSKSSICLYHSLYHSRYSPML